MKVKIMINGTIKEWRFRRFYKLTTPFNALKNATSDIWRMHDFNYKLPKEAKQDYWFKECLENPTSSHCEVD